MIDDDDIAWTVVIAAATSTDAGYNGLNPADVVLVNIDDDTAGYHRFSSIRHSHYGSRRSGDLHRAARFRTTRERHHQPQLQRCH
ncbi:MAG UNVERIFIED_CONTAM: hypothetical protein LVR18_27015 [Planctomycetaceae bacterium]